MTQFAKIEGGAVVSIVVSDGPWDGHDVEVPSDKAVKIGTSYTPVGGFVADDIAPPAPARRGLTSLEFMDLFTPTEEGAIRMLARSTDPAQAQASVQMEAFLARIMVADVIYLDDPRVVFGANALRALGILTTDARVTEVLSNIPPS